MFQAADRKTMALHNFLLSQKHLTIMVRQLPPGVYTRKCQATLKENKGMGDNGDVSYFCCVIGVWVIMGANEIPFSGRLCVGTPLGGSQICAGRGQVGITDIAN